MDIPFPFPFVQGCLHVGHRDGPWVATTAGLKCHSGDREDLLRAKRR